MVQSWASGTSVLVCLIKYDRADKLGSLFGRASVKKQHSFRVKTVEVTNMPKTQSRHSVHKMSPIGIIVKRNISFDVYVFHLLWIGRSDSTGFSGNFMKSIVCNVLIFTHYVVLPQLRQNLNAENFLGAQNTSKCRYDQI